MSSSQHPIALAIERRVGGAQRLLATVMILPLVDGVFPALILAGAVDDVVGIVEIGLLVFGGSATVAVILADMDGSPREQIVAVLGVGILLVPIAAVEATLAPTISSVLDLAVFERFAGLVILAIAAKTASARIGEFLPRPAVVIGIGLVASVDLSGAEFALATDPGLVVRGTAAAAVGVAFALLIAALGPWLRTMVDIDRFRFGSAVALGVLPLSIYGLVPPEAPLSLAVLGVTALLAIDPETGDGSPETAIPTTDGGVGRGDASSTANAADSGQEDDTPSESDSRDEQEYDRGKLPWI
ncbi:hypothetical protein HLRTI_000880 [Halorhabdus tiamatea SARL4B]|uniref:Conserved hypothetical membrane protein n=1 Tax=Halorhabdus tiamatea SARL4B TaxID=1033806 RepID=F7PKF7_9EURY|nr:DUF5794 domain-containing protein [Halorhabdus tiamatea]ERJ07027.1 hypothetical protein HLRTI_000880 [Halorhabdus tiamatea SARL4B]CCQ34795.1 conserved hypothetical membrane protein [Halorhabdus tiamatea SARL4B]